MAAGYLQRTRKLQFERGMIGKIHIAVVIQVRVDLEGASAKRG